MITGEVLGIEKDERNNIVIWICFSQDGEDISFWRGSELLEYKNRKVWPLVASYQSFIGKAPLKIKEWVEKNMKFQIGTIIKEISCKKTLCDEFVGKLAPLVGVKISSDITDIFTDLENIGTATNIVSLKDDSTYLVK